MVESLDLDVPVADLRVVPLLVERARPFEAGVAEAVGLVGLTQVVVIDIVPADGEHHLHPAHLIEIDSHLRQVDQLAEAGWPIVALSRDGDRPRRRDDDGSQALGMEVEEAMSELAAR